MENVPIFLISTPPTQPLMYFKYFQLAYDTLSLSSGWEKEKFLHNFQFSVSFHTPNGWDNISSKSQTRWESFSSAKLYYKTIFLIIQEMVSCLHSTKHLPLSLACFSVHLSSVYEINLHYFHFDCCKVFFFTDKNIISSHPRMYVVKCVREKRGSSFFYRNIYIMQIWCCVPVWIFICKCCRAP